MQAQMNSFLHDLLFKLFLAEAFAALIWFAMMAGLVFLIWKLFGKEQKPISVIIRREPTSEEKDRPAGRREPGL